MMSIALGPENTRFSYFSWTLHSNDRADSDSNHSWTILQINFGSIAVSILLQFYL